VVVLSDDPAFTAARVREVMAGELDGRTLLVEPSPSAGTLTVTFRPSRRELGVAYQEPGRGVVSRVVEAPATVDAAVIAAGHLARNLVADDTADLLGPAAPPPPPAPAALPAPPEAPVVSAAAAPPAPARPYQPVVAAVFHPLATNFAQPDVETRLSLSFLYGHVGRLRGLAFGGANDVEEDAFGGQVAFAFNATGGNVRGFQTALGFNLAGGESHGLQAAFGFNASGGGHHGAQLAMVVNTSAGPTSGVQAAAVNVAGDLRGLQLGFVNVAKNVKGAQLGLINVADDVEGLPLGLISVTRSGGVHPVLWTSTTAHANVGLKFSTRYTYTLFSASAHRSEEGDLVGPGLALGIRIPFAPLVFESDLGASFLFGGKVCCQPRQEGLSDDLLLTKGRALLGATLHHRFTLFVGSGLALRTRFYQGPDTVTNDLALELFGGVQL
jgi:hypothetical protein